LIVADAGPLIAFARIGRLDLLQDVLRNVIIPDAVYTELVTRGRGRPGSQEIAQSSWIIRQASSDPPLAAGMLSKLHQGEREAIALARNLNCQLLIDEHLGRRAAQDEGVDVIGSLSVLAEAKRLGLVELVRPDLEAIIREGYWIQPDLVVTFLASVGESDTARQ
jgi:predicted nucleic acid-binding protein